MSIHDELVALRAEVSKLRERIAVLETKPVPPTLRWAPQPYSDQFGPVWVNPAPNAAPPGVPYSPMITCQVGPLGAAVLAGIPKLPLQN